MTESRVTIPLEAESFLIELEERTNTGVLVAYDGALVGILGVADPLKREAAVVVEGLKKMGIEPVMVTGDNWRTARAVAREVSNPLPCYHAMLPWRIFTPLVQL